MKLLQEFLGYAWEAIRFLFALAIGCVLMVIVLGTIIMPISAICDSDIPTWVKIVEGNVYTIVWFCIMRMVFKRMVNAPFWKSTLGYLFA